MSLSHLLPAARGRTLALVATPVEEPIAWNLPMVAVSASLWGAGLVAPWDRTRVAELAAQLDLTSSDRVLLVGAGPGGVAQLLASVCGAEIFAYESDPVLATAGATRGYRPRHPEFGRHRFDHALILNGWAGGRMEDLLAAAAFAIRPGGRILLDATMADPVKACRILGHLRCDLERAEDHSSGLARTATTAWAHLATRLEQGGGESRLPVSGRTALRDMANDWAQRVQKLRTGQTRHVRLLAQGRGIGMRLAA